MNLQVVPDNVFSGTGHAVCPANLPTNTTCTFSTPSVNVTPGTPAPFQVTFPDHRLINPINTRLLTLPRFPSDWTGNAAASRPWQLGVLFAMVLLSPGLFSHRPSASAFHRRLPELHVRPAAAPLDPSSRTRFRAASPLAFAILAGCKKSTRRLRLNSPGSTNMVITGNSQNTSRGLSITLNVVTL